MHLVSAGKAALFGPMSNSPWLTDILALPLRLHIGISVCVGAGWSKMFARDEQTGELMKFPVKWFVTQVDGMGFPFPEFFAAMAIIAEVIGGALLALGLLTRSAALIVAIHFAVAAFLFHKVTPIRDINIAQLYTFAALAFVAIGGGRLSLDQVVRTLWKPASQGGTS